jgi:hypothetical protein
MQMNPLMDLPDNSGKTIKGFKVIGAWECLFYS